MYSQSTFEHRDAKKAEKPKPAQRSVPGSNGIIRGVYRAKEPAKKEERK